MDYYPNCVNDDSIHDSTEAYQYMNDVRQKHDGFAVDLTVSIVLYNTEASELQLLLDSLDASTLTIEIYLVSNDGRDYLIDFTSRHTTHSLVNQRNLGYGAANNLAITLASGKAPYHLIVNPDIHFDAGTLELIQSFLAENEQVVHLMPRIMYSRNGIEQHLCREIPTPLSLFGRLIYRRGIEKSSTKTIEAYKTDDNTYTNVPVLSGCFMFLRSSALQKANGFDERFFLYMEDVDLSMRLRAFGDSVYYTGATVYHQYKRGSASQLNLFRIHIESALRFFKKWGPRPKISYAKLLAQRPTVEEQVSQRS